MADEKVYGHFEWGRYPIQQCFGFTNSDGEYEVHMLDSVSRWGSRKFRCGWFLGSGGSCTFTTKEPPNCPECLKWFEDYMANPLLPFPNGHDVNGFWTHIPELLRPVPAWAEKRKKLS